MPFTKGHKINVGRKMSDNQKKKLSKNHAGKSNPMYGKPAWNKGRICPQLSGINNGFYNKHHDKKTRTRMSIAKSGTISNHWNGGIIYSTYIHIWDRKQQKYVRLHRRILELAMHKTLKSEWHCHHIDGNKYNNKLKNLMCFSSNSAHKRFEAGKNINRKEILFDGGELCKI